MRTGERAAARAAAIAFSRLRFAIVSAFWPVVTRSSTIVGSLRSPHVTAMCSSGVPMPSSSLETDPACCSDAPLDSPSVMATTRDSA
jgi:hypothetical protein